VRKSAAKADNGLTEQHLLHSFASVITSPVALIRERIA
jgi:hypothetical protein